MRTARDELHREGVEALRTTLGELGLTTREPAGDPAQVVDLVVDGPAGQLAIAVTAVSFADPSRVERLVTERRRSDGHASGTEILVLVADEVPERSRTALREHGWSYLDRRGALWFRSDALWIDNTQIAALPREPVTPSTDRPITGRVGLALAVLILMRPDRSPTVREIASALDCAPSSAHDALQRLKRAALIEPSGRPLTPDLFDVTAAAWNPRRTDVARAPRPGDAMLDLGLAPSSEALGSGWALAGDLAAAAWGAPVVVGSGAPPDFYVPAGIVRRAVRRLSGATRDERGASVAEAPLRAVTENRFDRASIATAWNEWPLAHPVVVALDLAQDPSRGREILDDWAAPEGFTCVWRRDPPR